MLRLHYFVFLVFFSPLRADKDTTPVFILDDNNVLSDDKFSPNPFVKLHSDEFELIVQKALTKATKIIIFVEDRLSTEDLSSKDSKGTPFNKLRSGLKLGTVKYHPAVSNPYQTLTSLIRQTSVNTYNMGRHSMTNNPDLLTKTSKSLYVFFTVDPKENRIETLRRHDAQIMDFFKNMRRSTLGNVVAFFTGKFNPVKIKSQSKVLRKEEQKPEEKPVPEHVTVTLAGKGALLKLQGVRKAGKLQPSRSTTYSQISRDIPETLSSTDLKTTVAYKDFDLRFNFMLRAESWLLDSVSLLVGPAEVGRTVIGISNRWNCSYMCQEPITIHNTKDNSIFTIAAYQIEPHYDTYIIASRIARRHSQPISLIFDEYFLRSGTKPRNTIETFSVPEHCGPFFTSPILSGTLVAATIFLITASGVMAMFDLRTNDKLDDVHHTKRLTIIEN